MPEVVRVTAIAGGTIPRGADYPRVLLSNGTELECSAVAWEADCQTGIPTITLRVPAHRVTLDVAPPRSLAAVDEWRTKAAA